MNADTTPCAFCGHADHQHRVRDAMLSRWLAGESFVSLARDYGKPVKTVKALLRQAIQEKIDASS